MEKKKFVTYLNDLFRTYNYKRKGNKWFAENDDLLKIIELQKSVYGNFYYINYGFVLKKIELNASKMHISYGLSSTNTSENNRIKELLDFESIINDEERWIELKNYLEKIVLDKMQSINTEQDLLYAMKQLQNLNLVPVSIKKHFNFM